MATALNGNRRHDVAEIKQVARGRWKEILLHHGMAEHDLDGRHHPCPKCGGNDRFRLMNEAEGAVICSHCHATKNGDGIAALQWWTGRTFTEVLDLVAGHLGLAESNQPKLDPLEIVCRSKRIPRESLEAYGAKVQGRDVVLPVYGPEGECCSSFKLPPDGKGLFAAGNKAGLFWPHVASEPRLPSPGETWHVVEGPKDAAALHSIGLQAVGLNTRLLHPKFGRLFAGCVVVIIPDRDEPGENGARRTAAALARRVKSIRIATLPAELKATGGEDVRDILAKPNGRQLLDQAIRDARPVDDTGTPVEVKKLERITAAEMAVTEIKVDYLAQGVLARKQAAVLGGPSKAMKTTTLMDLSISLCSGRPFLGAFAVPEAVRVGLVSAESGKATLFETAGRIARAKGLNLADLGDSLIVSTTMPKVDKPDGLDALEQFCRDDALDVLGIDPAYLAFSGVADKAANVFAMGEVLLPLAERCTALGVTLIVAHHSRRSRTEGNTRFEALELEELAFAGWAEFARQWLLVNRREKYIEGTGQHRLWLRAGGSAGHSGLWGVDVSEGPHSAAEGRDYDVTVIPANEVRADEKQRTAAEKAERDREDRDKNVSKLLEAMKQWPEGECIAEIRAAAELGEKRAKDLLWDLHREGVIARCQVQKPNRKKPYDGWKLIPEDQR